MAEEELEKCLSFRDDIDALEHYLTEHEEGKNFEYVDGDDIINIVENVLPLHFKQIKENFTGYIVGRQNDTHAQINNRNIKFLKPENELPIGEGWKVFKVTVPRGSLCYISRNDFSDEAALFTKASLHFH
jgi:hypothetical protein